MEMTRRRMLGSLCGFAATASLAQMPGAAGALRKSRMRPLGIQLYMLSKPLDADFSGTLREIAAIGYREVELAGFHNRTGRELRAALDSAGLRCPSLHVPLEPMLPGLPSLENPAAILDVVKALGATELVVPGFPIPKRFLPRVTELRGDLRRIGAALAEISQAMTADDWVAFAKRLNELGAQLAKSGVNIGYHNHNLEFARLGNGNTSLEILIGETDPKLVSFELDVGWTAGAGVDPAEFLKRHANRISQLHLKDTAGVTPTTELGFKTAEFGEGIVDWPRLTHIIKNANIKHLYVEQEEPFRTSPMDAACGAFAFFSGMADLKSR